MREKITRCTSVKDYNSDKFKEVTSIKTTNCRGNEIKKVNFITDYVFKTWCNARNLRVYNDERGAVNDGKHTGENIEEQFYESRIE